MSTLKLYKSNVDLRSMLMDIKNMYALSVNIKGISMDLSISDDIPHKVCADEMRIKQVMHNLVGNAIKYTVVGTIKIQCVIEQNNILIEITDTGIGIKKEYQSKVFRLFDSINQNESSNGIGLGLYISNIIIKSMGGTITFTSREGIGSTFKCLFPLDSNEVPETLIYPISLQSLITNDSECCPRVLIVDDNMFNLRVLESMLNKMGIKCEKAVNGLNALEEVKKSQHRSCCKPLEIVFMDCNMPIMDGYKATEELMKMMHNREIARVAIIGVTAYTSSEHLECCSKSGMVKTRIVFN